MKRFKVAVFPGDGIGPETVAVAVKVMNVVAELGGAAVDVTEGLVGGASIDAESVPLTDAVLGLALDSDAVLLGAVGGPKWEGLDYAVRPERALLALRSSLALFANLRPAIVYAPLVDASTLKREVIEGVDIMVVRELTGGIYFGEPRGVETLADGSKRGVNTLVYTTSEIERIARAAFEVATKRLKRVTSVDKANVLETTELWRDVVTRVGADEFPDVELNHMYVDNCAMQLIRDPGQFDVIVTGNMFGDILSDEAAMLTGSIGMLPSASLGDGSHAMYEPVHGSAPDIAGKDLANPIATVLSIAMMFRYTFDMPEAALMIERAVEAVLDKGFRTQDIYMDKTRKVGCSEMGSLLLGEITSGRTEG